MTQRKARRQRRVRGGSPVSIHVRTTATSHAALADRAALAGLSVPRYLVESGLRDSATGWSLRQQRWWVERLDTAETRLIRIGTNLNQLALVANSTGHPPEGLSAALDYLCATLDQLRMVLDAIDPADASREQPP